MGYGRALLQRDVLAEEKSFKKKAKKKSLWGSIGRTIGGLGAMALTGGAANPVTLGLLTGGASFLGGAIGASTLGGGKLTGGRFFKSDRESAQKELGAFGTQNITASLKSGLTAGIGQKLKLGKEAASAKLADPNITDEALGAIRKGKGFDFGESFVGKTKFGKDIISKQYFKDKELSEFVDPNLQVSTESGKKIIAMDRRTHTSFDPSSASIEDQNLQRALNLQSELDKPASSVPISIDRSANETARINDMYREAIKSPESIKDFMGTEVATTDPRSRSIIEGSLVSGYRQQPQHPSNILKSQFEAQDLSGINENLQSQWDILSRTGRNVRYDEASSRIPWKSRRSGLGSIF